MCLINIILLHLILGKFHYRLKLLSKYLSLSKNDDDYVWMDLLPSQTNNEEINIYYQKHLIIQALILEVSDYNYNIQSKHLFDSNLILNNNNDDDYSDYIGKL